MSCRNDWATSVGVAVLSSPMSSSYSSSLHRSQRMRRAPL
jgi:hypothetical protein